MSSNSSLHHTTFNTVAQAEMQEAEAARWSNSSQEKVRELETESEHREMSATLHHVLPTHNLKMFICSSSKSGKLLHLQNDNDHDHFHAWMLETVPSNIAELLWSSNIRMAVKNNCPTVYMLLWELLLQAMKTYNTFSITCSASRPKLITIPTSILNVVKAELTFTGEGLFCISQCIIVRFLAPSSRSL